MQTFNHALPITKFSEHVYAHTPLSHTLNVLGYFGIHPENFCEYSYIYYKSTPFQGKVSYPSQFKNKVRVKDGAQLTGGVLVWQVPKSPGSHARHCIKPGVVMHTCNLNTLGGEGRRIKLKGILGEISSSTPT